MRKAATDCVELHHGGRAGTALDPHPARRIQQSCRQGPAAALGSQRSGEPVLAASRRAGAIGPARDTALLAHRGPAAAVQAWLDGGVMRAVGRALLEGEMHGSPPHPAGSERDEPVPGMISGGAPPTQAPPEMHDPALAADRTWSPRRETARLAAFRPLAFPAGPWPAIRPPVLHHLAPGPWPGQTGPASVADQQTAHVMAVAAAPPHHRGQPQSAKPEPPATSRQRARDNPADRAVSEAAAWKIRPSRPRPAGVAWRAG
jgi:hypothetical protein